MAPRLKIQDRRIAPAAPTPYVRRTSPAHPKGGCGVRPNGVGLTPRCATGCYSTPGFKRASTLHGRQETCNGIASTAQDFLMFGQPGRLCRLSCVARPARQFEPPPAGDPDDGQIPDRLLTKNVSSSRTTATS